MVHQADRGREALLDAAEQLFATHGVDAVSNRRIAELAGNANHSAVTYHFGSRDEMIRVLLARDATAMRARRRELVAALEPHATLADVLATRILPWMEALDALPRPSWRARFVNQVRTVAALDNALREAATEFADVDEVMVSSHSAVEGVPTDVLRRRSGLLAVMILGACADVEERMAVEATGASWTDVGSFLVDAAAGMLAAPVTARPTSGDQRQPS